MIMLQLYNYDQEAEFSPISVVFYDTHDAAQGQNWCEGLKWNLRYKNLQENGRSSFETSSSEMLFGGHYLFFRLFPISINSEWVRFRFTS